MADTSTVDESLPLKNESVTLEIQEDTKIVEMVEPKTKDSSSAPRGAAPPLQKVGSFFSESKKKRKKMPMLTSSQLADLFRRLDRDGNGELDIDEFISIASKLKLNVPEAFFAEVFKEVDVAKSGTLSMPEFILAYQRIISKANKSNVDWKKYELADKDG